MRGSAGGRLRKSGTAKVALLLPGGLGVRGRASGHLPGAAFSHFCKFLAGSVSAVPKRNFARTYAFDRIFQNLQDVHTFAPLQSQKFSKNRFEKSAIFVKIQQNFVANVAKFAKLKICKKNC